MLSLSSGYYGHAARNIRTRVSVLFCILRQGLMCSKLASDLPCSPPRLPSESPTAASWVLESEGEWPRVAYKLAFQFCPVHCWVEETTFFWGDATTVFTLPDGHSPLLVPFRFFGYSGSFISTWILEPACPIFHFCYFKLMTWDIQTGLELVSPCTWPSLSALLVFFIFGFGNFYAKGRLAGIGSLLLSGR